MRNRVQASRSSISYTGIHIGSPKMQDRTHGQDIAIFIRTYRQRGAIREKTPRPKNNHQSKGNKESSEERKEKGVRPTPQEGARGCVEVGAMAPHFNSSRFHLYPMWCGVNYTPMESRGLKAALDRIACRWRRAPRDPRPHWTASPQPL